MRKTLLDEFALVALAGILAKFDYSPTDAAGEAYLYADAMMAERVKRMDHPAFNIEKTPAELQQFRKMTLGEIWSPEPTSAVNSDLLAVINSMTGRKVTCSELFRAAYLREGNMEELREVGGILRHRGYQKHRSGGKDYYQL